MNWKSLNLFCKSCSNFDAFYILIYAWEIIHWFFVVTQLHTYTPMWPLDARALPSVFFLYYFLWLLQQYNFFLNNKNHARFLLIRGWRSFSESKGEEWKEIANFIVKSRIKLQLMNIKESTKERAINESFRQLTLLAILHLHWRNSWNA